MAKLVCTIILCAISAVTAFVPQMPGRQDSSIFVQRTKHSAAISRSDFMTVVVPAIGATTFMPNKADARGRATLEFSYDRYTPRILDGGIFYANDLKKAIANNDWKAIKAATDEPPPRSKEDKSKIDGGIAERAAKAGGFSVSRVISACDLFAASFSDNSISAKTKKMKTQTAILTEVVEEMNYTAKLALGEVKPSGGVFGIGAKPPSQSELTKKVRELYVTGGNAWNQYIYAANDELPVQLKKLPYL
jgi:hypothetical protein